VLVLELRIGVDALRCNELVPDVIPERARTVAGDTRVCLDNTLRTRVLAFRTSSGLRFFADVIT
jgi:hypothetical protein